MEALTGLMFFRIGRSRFIEVVMKIFIT